MTEIIKHRHFKIGTAEVPYREQERDVEIGVWLTKRRFLDADQICRLVEVNAGGSHDRTKVRLTKMHRLGLIGKPEQKEYWGRCGRNLHIYGNKDKMARRLQKEGILPAGRLDWSKKVSSVGNDFVEHTVETSELMVTFETTMRRYQDFRVREVDELLTDLPERTQTVMRPWVFEGVPNGFPATAKKKARVRPDAILSVRQETGDEVREQYFVAEIDTTSMTVVRDQGLEKKLRSALLDLKQAKGTKHELAAQSLVEQARDKLLVRNVTIDQPSFMRKFITYFWAYKQGWHEEHLGWPAFRVLVTTRNASHRDRMIEALQYVTGGQAPNLFLFTTFAEIRQCDDIFKHEWLNGAGKAMTLMVQK